MRSTKSESEFFRAPAIIKMRISCKYDPVENYGEKSVESLWKSGLGLWITPVENFIHSTFPQGMGGFPQLFHRFIHKGFLSSALYLSHFSTDFASLYNYYNIYILLVVVVVNSFKVVRSLTWTLKVRYNTH